MTQKFKPGDVVRVMNHGYVVERYKDCVAVVVDANPHDSSVVLKFFQTHLNEPKGFKLIARAILTKLEA